MSPPWDGGYGGARAQPVPIAAAAAAPAYPSPLVRRELPVIACHTPSAQAFSALAFMKRYLHLVGSTACLPSNRLLPLPRETGWERAAVGYKHQGFLGKREEVACHQKPSYSSEF